MRTGLVLEGGAMRGLYTVGVLDYLMEKNIAVNYVIGVSAGACNGVSYVSNQKGRSLRVNTEYIGDKRYLSLANFIKTKSMFGMDFIFDEIPNKLDPFDYDAFLSSPCEFVVGVTDVFTGKPLYFGKEDLQRNSTVIRASSSIPIFAPIVEYNGGRYLDGGTSDPIPVKKAFADGCDKVIVVLTQHRAYMKDPTKMRPIYRRMFRNYPSMIRLLDVRHNIYNETRKLIFHLERLGKALVIAPSEPITIGRFEKDMDNLMDVYNLGYGDADEKYSEILSFLGKFV